jgi:hypothetical protein
VQRSSGARHRTAQPSMKQRADCHAESNGSHNAEANASQHNESARKKLFHCYQMSRAQLTRLAPALHWLPPNRNRPRVARLYTVIPAAVGTQMSKRGGEAPGGLFETEVGRSRARPWEDPALASCASYLFSGEDDRSELRPQCARHGDLAAT